MKTTISVRFNNDVVQEFMDRKTTTFDGYPPIPNVGDTILNPGFKSDKRIRLAGVVVSRSFTYEEDSTVRVLIEAKATGDPIDR